MKKQWSIISIIIFLLFINIQNISASCVIQGYAKDINQNFVDYNVNAYCELDNSWRNITRIAGDLYGVSWGGPADSCQGYCDNVWITGTNSTYSISGHPDDGYPMNSTTTSGWATGSAHNSNITMKEQEYPISYFGTNPINNLRTNQTTIIFDGKCTDNVGLNKFSIFGSWGGWGDKGFQSTPINNTWYNLSIGSIPAETWVWNVWCNDTSDNSAFNSTNRTLIVDLVAPVVSIQSPSNTTYNYSTVWFNATTNENSYWCAYSLDGGTNQTMSNDSMTHWYAQPTTTEGQHNIIFSCNDTAGNYAQSSLRYFFVDLTNPLASFGTNPVNTFNSTNSTVWFELKCSDNHGLSYLELWTNSSGSWSAKQSNISPINDTIWNVSLSLSDGTYRWSVFCNDSGGNFDWENTNRTFNVNTSAPDVAPYVYTNNPTNGSTQTSNTVTFNVECIDDYGTSYALIYGNWSGGWHINATNSSIINATWWNPQIYLPNGAYLWGAWCNDSIGLTNSSVNITFFVEYSSGGGGGGGGGGGNVCTSYKGICYNGTSCPSNTKPISYSCGSTLEVCCSKNICDICKPFVSSFGMLSYSVLEFENLFSSVQNDSLNITKEELKDYLTNYNSKCGMYCFLFDIPFLGKYLEIAGRFFYKTNPCIASIILVVLILILISFYFYKKKKKRRH